LSGREGLGMLNLPWSELEVLELWMRFLFARLVAVVISVIQIKWSTEWPYSGFFGGRCSVFIDGLVIFSQNSRGKWESSSCASWTAETREKQRWWDRRWKWSKR